MPRCGAPQAVCCDKKHAYVISREPTISEIEYLPKINKKFASEPLDSQDRHASCPIKEQLADIFCYEEQRVVRDYSY